MQPDPPAPPKRRPLPTEYSKLVPKIHASWLNKPDIPFEVKSEKFVQHIQEFGKEGYTFKRWRDAADALDAYEMSDIEDRTFGRLYRLREEHQFALHNLDAQMDRTKRLKQTLEEEAQTDPRTVEYVRSRNDFTRRSQLQRLGYDIAPDAPQAEIDRAYNFERNNRHYQQHYGQNDQEELGDFELNGDSDGDNDADTLAALLHADNSSVEDFDLS